MPYDLILGHGTTIVDVKGGMVTPTAGSAVLSVGPQMLRGNGDRYHGELQYLGLLKELIDKHEADPTPRADRTGTGTFSVFGRQMRFNLDDGFPLLTTKRIHTKSMIAELLWMLSGDTNVRTLQEQGVRIWDEWADDDGDLGPVYGAQWRRWNLIRAYAPGSVPPKSSVFSAGGSVSIAVTPIDQIAQLIENLQTKPNDRGHVVSAWNVADLPRMALRPCHCLFQFYVEDGKLSCQLYQRSADIFLGVPFNIASYALLTHLIANEVGLQAGEFVHTFGDLHLYANHVEQAKEQLTRTPREFPVLRYRDDRSLFEFKPEDIQFDGYDPHPTIKAEVSI